GYSRPRQANCKQCKSDKPKIANVIASLFDHAESTSLVLFNVSATPPYELFFVSFALFAVK
ncbi:MAG TPA: hypothetical protein VGK77_00370, partial [Candidatus Binatia bacterium]